MTKLYVIHKDNLVYKDYTKTAWDFRRDSFALPIVAAEDKLYVGYSKPINAFYAETLVVNDQASTMTAKYYNGSAFTAIASAYDDTQSFKRSGFVKWDRNLTSEAKTTINSIEAYWYEISFSADLKATTSLMAINILFSDDNDLLNEISNINSYLASGETSFVLKHLSARNQIIQQIRNDGKYKVDLNSGTYRDIDAFDLLDFEQIRQASIYLTLYKIFFDVSNDLEDAHYKRAKEYYGLFKSAFNVFYLSLDANNNGKNDVEENLKSYNTKVFRR